MKSTFRQIVIGATLLAAIQVAPAQAQSRTWVASNGDDGFPCSRTAPCKTLAGAISKTAAGGEISVIDSGEYGPVLITKAITINGEGNLASISAGGGTAINIAAGATDRVIIRNLSLTDTSGGSTSTRGINITSGNVTIDKCFIYGFAPGAFNGTAINVAASSAVNIDVRDTDITNTAYGFYAQAQGSGSVVGSLDNVRINDASNGVNAVSATVFLTVQNSFLRFIRSTAVTALNGSTINVGRSELVNSGTAVWAYGAGSTIRLSNNALYDNNTTLVIGSSATIASAGNNKGINNGVAPNGSFSGF
jgi:hypothetical protein